MTVDAGFSIVSHVGVTLRVDERIRALTHGEAEGNAQNNSRDQAKPHNFFEAGTEQTPLSEKPRNYFFLV